MWFAPQTYLGHIPPGGFEVEYYAQLEVPPTDGAAIIEAA
jgi:hypothetical protein